MADRRDIDRLLLELERQPGLAKGTVQDIREAINTSPYLVSVMTPGATYAATLTA